MSTRKSRNCNWRATEAEARASMDGGDWRTQLQPDSRSTIVNIIMETLKKHLPISGPEGLGELQKIALRFEEKIYSAATSQSDYLGKIYLKILTMEIKSQSCNGPNFLQLSFIFGNQNPSDSASMDWTAQIGNDNSTDWQEETYQKVKSMKELYFPELSEMHHKVCLKIQQHKSLAESAEDPMDKSKKLEQVENLKIMNQMLENWMRFLLMSKNTLTLSHRDNLLESERRIISFVNMNRRRGPSPEQELLRLQSLRLE